MKPLLLILTIYLFSIGFVNGQAQPDTIKQDKKDTSECPQEDIGDLLRKKGTPPPPHKNFNALVMPYISSNPTNGFLLGISGAFSWFMGPESTTRVSSAPFNIAVTSKKQFISFLKTNIFLADDSYFLQGDWRFYLYSQPTYGLGTNAPDSGGLPPSFHWQGEGGPDDSVSFPMKFNYIKFHEIVAKKIKENLYAGVGYHFDYYYAIKDSDLHLDATPPLLTPHYVYSKKYSFDTAQYVLSGLSVNLVYDSRDNMINTYSGMYVNISYRYNFNILGSEHDASSLWTEFRTYFGLSKKKARNVLAFWLFGNFNLSGQLPYLTLPALGDDQRARSGRGYTNGRFRGNNMIYGEAEWRFPISQCSQILGGVVFINAVTTDNPDRNVVLFQYIQPAVGFGFRVMINKYFRTNVNLDFAIGRKSKGVYFSGQETF